MDNKKTDFHQSSKPSELSTLRKEYTQPKSSGEFTDPISMFSSWFNAAINQNIPEANCFALGTCSQSGHPSVRMLLLKEYDQNGFVFFTNYESRKASELRANARAAMAFYWEPLERQIRIEGTVAKVSRAESDAYFSIRPRGAQLAASVSKQSSTLSDREELLKRLENYQLATQDQILKRPEHWGGYRLTPTYFEFWQGAPDRLHHREIFSISSDLTWTRSELEP